MNLLLINPWITDVAAFDLWARPLGLLCWAARLRDGGARVAMIDCTDRAHPSLTGRTPPEKPFHTGKYRAEPFDFQPEPARRAGKPFRRYGISPEAFERELAACQESFEGPPDAILAGSRMTYWHHGVADAIARCRARWPETPIALGGVYATLCPEHAREHSGADAVFQGDAFEALPRWLNERASDAAPAMKTASPDPEAWPRPAYDLCHSRDALPLLTSVGCPFDCSYCASKLLAPRCRRRAPGSVYQELRDCHERWGTVDFAFYDDALLVEAPRYLEPFLDRVIEDEAPVRFHTPNGMHYWLIDPPLARKMKRAGFETVRLSLETIEPERLAAWGRRGDLAAFQRAVAALREAGFSREQVGVYVMAGMPGQTVDEVRQTLEAVSAAGAHPQLNEFSPIPGAREWERALELAGRQAREELLEDPLWQNNSLYYTRGEVFDVAEMQHLKRLAREARHAVG
jgi:radical SAM superfamily enzyme YgiQ (UPF0313 family)